MGFVADNAAPAGGKFAPDANDELSRENLTKEVTNENYRIPGTDARIPGTGGVNQFLISTGRGMIDLWAGGKQIALGVADKVSPRETKLGDLVTGKKSREEEYTADQQGDLQQFAKLEAEAPATAFAGRIVGQVAPTLAVPGGAIASGLRQAGAATGLPLLARAGMGTEAGIMGGLQGMMNFTSEGESRAANALTGAASALGLTKGMEAGARFLGPSVRRGMDWVKGKVDEVVGKPGLAEMAGTKAATSSDELATALKSEGIDWATLPAAVREGVQQLADEAGKAGAPVSTAELARVVRAQKLPGGRAELTKGQMTQDRSQLRAEFDLRRTSAGKSLDDQLMQQDEALANSLDVIKLKTGGATTAGREAEAGELITKPLVEQLRKSQSEVTRLYKAADEAGETLAEVNAEPLAQFLIQNRAASISVPELRTIAAKLKDMGVASGDDLSKVTGAAAWLEREPTVRELEELRKLAVKLGRGNDAAGHWMGDLKHVIDSMTEGKGGELYGKARAARIAQRQQFEDPGVINRLVSEKPGGDRVTAFEDVFKKSVVNGSVDDLTKLRGQLLEGAGDDKALQGQGVQAFKDLRAATMDYIKMGALNNAKDEFSYAGFKKSVESIGREKMEVLFGKNAANEIFSTLESAKDMKAVFNKSGIYNPGTASALVEWIDRISGIVGLGKAGTYGRIYATGAAKKVMETIQQPKAVEEASKPVAAAMRAGAEAQDDLYRQLLGTYAGRMGAKAAPGIGAAVAAPDEKQ